MPGTTNEPSLRLEVQDGQSKAVERQELSFSHHSSNTQNYIMIVFVALIQGSLDLCSLSYFYIYLYDFKTTPSQLAVLQGLASIPWIFKPAFGFLSDRIRFLGYHRKSYIFTISLVEFATHILMFKYKFDLHFVVFFQLIQVVCVAFRNVIGGRPGSSQRDSSLS